MSSAHTQVVNIRKTPVGTPVVFIGRPSVYGNPYRIGRDGTREQVIEKFEELMRFRLREDPARWVPLLEKLRGKILGCYCAPLPCHGSVYVKLLEERRRTVPGKCVILFKARRPTMKKSPRLLWFSLGLLAYLIFLIVLLFTALTLVAEEGFAAEEDSMRKPEPKEKVEVLLTLERQKDGTYVARTMRPIKLAMVPVGGNTGAEKIQTRCTIFRVHKKLEIGVDENGNKRAILINGIRAQCGQEVFDWNGLIFDEIRP